MRVGRLCHNLLTKKTSIHQKRITVVSDVVETVVTAKTLSVTGVGRKMKNLNQTRSNIRKADRLYSNINLVLEKDSIYAAICRTIIKVKAPLIAIDGSKVPNSPWYILRASLVSSGRGITLYELMYECSEQGDRKLYAKFLDGLEKVIGKKKCPILITDAEFRGPWFKLVLAKNWDFIARIRGKTKVSVEDGLEADDWQDLWPKATSKPKRLGEGYFSNRLEIDGYFYLHKKPNKGRHAHTRSGRHSETIKSRRHKISAEEPWLIFSSLDYPAKYIVTAYGLRMTIEENFRDTKSGRYGLGLKMTFSKKKRRCVVMLLIAALASLIAYVIGTAAELAGLQRKFQANSTRHQRVLSRFFLGCEVIYKNIKITYKQWIKAILYLRKDLTLCFID